jgi:hypothetical protein
MLYDIILHVFSSLGKGTCWAYKVKNEMRKKVNTISFFMALIFGQTKLQNITGKAIFIK